MTDEELRAYLNCRVELRLTSGETLAGELVAEDARLVLRQPYAVKTVQQSATLGVEEPSWRGIPSADTVESVRVVEQLPAIED